jgi:hypothetical protein
MDDLLDRIDQLEELCKELAQVSRQLALENTAMKMMIKADIKKHCGFFCALPECPVQLSKGF